MMQFSRFFSITRKVISQRREEVLKQPRDRFLDREIRLSVGLNVGVVFVQTQPVPKVRRQEDGEGVLFRRRRETIPLADSPERDYD